MQKMPRKSITEETYDNAARGYAEKFKDIGVRSADVDEAFGYINKENPLVIEIGCGAGREAEYILTKTNRYVGVDISEGMLALARESLPGVQFEKADVAEYCFPKDVDAVFAFASLLHSDKQEVAGMFQRVTEVQSSGGIVYISLKRKDEYSSAVTKDQYGPRTFFYYTRVDILEAAGDSYEEMAYAEQERTESWFTIILKKK